MARNDGQQRQGQPQHQNQHRSQDQLLLLHARTAPSAAAAHLRLDLLLYCCHAALLLGYRVQRVPQLRLHG